MKLTSETFVNMTLIKTAGSFVVLCLCISKVKLNYGSTEIEMEEVISINCYEEYIYGGVPDIANDIEPPPKEKSIFFHETSCKPNSNFTLVIEPRQACAVESAARLHPNYKVYLLYNSPIRYPDTSTNLTRNYKIIQTLLSYRNIQIRRLNFEIYTKGTPLEKWYQERILTSSKFPFIHSSDVLRYLTLWKYGGTYLDLDIVVMKNLAELQHNYAGKESASLVNNAVLNVDADKFGHRVMEQCMREIVDNSKRFIHWKAYGGELLTKVLNMICTPEETCGGFKFLDISMFYPIHWEDWNEFYDPQKSTEVLSRVNKSYAIHLWNNLSRHRKMNSKHNPAAFHTIAEKFCPKIYKEFGADI